MGNIIRNAWSTTPGGELASITTPTTSPEGLEVRRYRQVNGPVTLDPSLAHVLSVIGGELRAEWPGKSLTLDIGSTLYVPQGLSAKLSASGGAWVQVSSPDAASSSPLVRHERFVAASATETQSLRWILTPQYLSRRIFLHHDAPLRSRAGKPVSWFRTTMFDVAGLPKNDEGEAVFKMSYNSKTELNVCYDVAGDARVRMAKHPYASGAWHAWEPLDSDASYHLNEAEDGPELEWVTLPSGKREPRRNKHEVYSAGGHVTLFCLFDPAPTGIERHREGEYSDYQDIRELLGTPELTTHRANIGRYDEMVDALSWAHAEGTLGRLRDSELYGRFLEGRAHQIAHEERLLEALRKTAPGRVEVLSGYRLAPETSP